MAKKNSYFIENMYNMYNKNKKRLYSSLGYRPPEEYERLFAKNGLRECMIAKTKII